MTPTKSEMSHFATADRINSIIKYEFGFIKKLLSMEVAQKMIGQTIEIYIKERRHKLLNMKTPAQAHKENNHWAAFRQHKFYKKIKSQKTET